MSRTKGVDLENSVALRIFSDNVPLSQCKPKDLWKLSKIAKNGQSSEWGIFDRCFSTLNDLADAGVGRVPRQKTLHSQFAEWLSNQIPPIVWAFKDSDRAVMHIRTMLQSLQGLKRNQRQAPRNHAKLQIIVDKMVVDSSEIVDGPDVVAEHNNIDTNIFGEAIKSSSESDNDSENSETNSLEIRLFGESALQRPVQSQSISSQSLPTPYPFASIFQQFTTVPIPDHEAHVPVHIADHEAHVPVLVADHSAHVPVLKDLADHSAYVPVPHADHSGHVPVPHAAANLLDAAALAKLAAGCDTTTTAPLPQDYTAMKKKRKKTAVTAATSAVVAGSDAPKPKRRLRKKSKLDVENKMLWRPAVEAESGACRGAVVLAVEAESYFL